MLNIDELKIDKSEEVLSLDWKLESVVKKYSFAVEVKGLEYVTAIVGCINGLSDCYHIGKGYGASSSQPIYFEVKKDGNKVVALFHSFQAGKGYVSPDTNIRIKERNFPWCRRYKVDLEIYQNG